LTSDRCARIPPLVPTAIGGSFHRRGATLAL
jgi:hypothetical protein